MSEKASVKLSTKSWHFKLVKFILGSAAPTPHNMHNLCPYFWLLVFSLLVTPVVAPVKGFFKLVFFVLDKVANLMDKFLIIPAATSWEEKLTDLDVFYIYNWDQELNKLYKMAHKEENLDRRNFVHTWWEKKFGKPSLEKSGRESSEFAKWIVSQYEAAKKLEVEDAKRRIEQKKPKYEEKMSSFRNNLDGVFTKISKTVSSWKDIIKWTKRVVGLIVTSIGLVLTFFVVSYMGRAILWLIERWDWSLFLHILLVLVCAAVAIGILIALVAFGTYCKERGMKLWYVKVSYYLSLVIVIPVKIIFYRLIWQLILVNLWFLVKRGAQGAWKSLLGFLGIFGEYFGASYTDYCPGIEWDKDSK
jgi:hypothetical protein